MYLYIDHKAFKKKNVIIARRFFFFFYHEEEPSLLHTHTHMYEKQQTNKMTMEAGVTLERFFFFLNGTRKKVFRKYIPL